VRHGGDAKNGVTFKVGSVTPDRGDDGDDRDDSGDDFGGGLAERLREMDVTDLASHRDVLTQQIATSLVALHQVNQELDRRRRRKSGAAFRNKSASSSSTSKSWSSGKHGKMADLSIHLPC
jgi:hypothetical protein